MRMMNASLSQAPEGRTAVDVGRACLSEDDGPNGTGRLDEATTLLQIATDYREYRWLDKAKRLARRALTIFERELGPAHPNVATVLLCLAGVHRDRTEYAAAEAHYRRAISILNRVSDEQADPKLAKLRIELMRGLADVVCALGRHCEAETMLKQALAMAERNFGRHGVLSACILSDLGVCYIYTGQFEKASGLLRDALTIAEKAAGPDDRHVAPILHSLAVLDLVRGRFDEGAPFARRSVEIREKTAAPEHPQKAAAVVTLAAILDGQGRRAEAESAYRRALLMLERWFGPDHYDVGTTLNCLATVLRAQGRVAEAEPMYCRAIAILKRPLGATHVQLETQPARCA